jgi:hypothetical protein
VNRSKPRNSTGVSTRSVRVADRFWAQWMEAAHLAGTDRNKFIVAVVNNAADQVRNDARVIREREMEREEMERKREEMKEMEGGEDV